MKRSASLSELIHSMKQSEKRYFKIYSSLHVKGDANNYVALFNAIDKQKTYNEKELLKKHKHEPFSKNFRFAKHYLYRLLLKSMRIYHADSTVESEVQNTIRDINFLNKNGLYAQSSKLLTKAKKTATEFEKHFTMLELLRIEQKITQRLTKPQNVQNTLNDIYNKQMQQMENLSNVISYQWLLDKLFAFTRLVGQTADKKSKEKYTQILEHPLLKDEKYATTDTSKVLFHQIFAAYYFYTKDYYKSNDHSRKIISIIENKGTDIMNNPLDYLLFLSRLIVSYETLGNRSRVLELIQKTQSIVKEIKTEIPTNTLIHIYGQEHSFYFHTGQFQKALDMIPQFNTILEKGKKEVPIEIPALLHYNFAYINFVTGNYKEALVWINQILKQKRSIVRKDIMRITHILNLLTHFELDNRDYSENLYLSLHRMFVKDNALGKFEKTALELISKQLSFVGSRDEKIKFFKKIYNELKKAIKDPAEYQKLEQFDLVSWLESKIKGKTFSEIMKRKARSGGN